MRLRMPWPLRATPRRPDATARRASASHVFHARSTMARDRDIRETRLPRVQRVEREPNARRGRAARRTTIVSFGRHVSRISRRRTRGARLRRKNLRRLDDARRRDATRRLRVRDAPTPHTRAPFSCESTPRASVSEARDGEPAVVRVFTNRRHRRNATTAAAVAEATKAFSS